MHMHSDISVEEVSIGAHAWKAGTYGQATAPLAVVAVDGHAPPGGLFLKLIQITHHTSHITRTQHT